ncbi:MAG: RluA family pseudouridine synthase [Rickettsiales bacterium]|nr:RluA family pseudouridine synthase [Rickettsiales bacterium]
MTMEEKQATTTVSADDEGIRLDRWFKRHYESVPHALLEKSLRKGVVRVDGKKAKTSDRVAEGQTISAPATMLDPKTRPKRTLSDKDASELQKMVLYKDANVIVLNKPAGLAVQGGTKITKNLDDMLDALTFDAKDRPRLIHRIDRDTTGALVLARSAKVAALLAKGFAGKTIEKTYLALVNGSPMPQEGYIDLPLAKIGREGGGEQMGVDEEEGKVSRTEYRVRDTLARKFAVVELKPLTGRMHQLRVHMAAIDCPIVGDHKYGGGNVDAESLGVENILHLHAWRIHIPSLPGGKAISVTAPLPPHMTESFKALGLDIPKK